MARHKTEQVRQEIAQIAARLMAVEGVVDYLSAKKKAAEQMGIQQSKFYPSNKEIELALRNYQTLFLADSQPKQLQALRNTAIRAMKLFEEFNPYLTGSVLHGTASAHSEIVLHIYTDTPEHIDTLLMDVGIPFELCERRARFKHKEQMYYPAYQFLAEDDKIILIIFPEKRKNHSPLNAVDGHPEKRVTLSQAKQIFQEHVAN